jgi:hypothetical protein
MFRARRGRGPRPFVARRVAPDAGERPPRPLVRLGVEQAACRFGAVDARPAPSAGRLRAASRSASTPPWADTGAQRTRFCRCRRRPVRMCGVPSQGRYITVAVRFTLS